MSKRHFIKYDEDRDEYGTWCGEDARADMCCDFPLEVTCKECLVEMEKFAPLTACLAAMKGDEDA